MAADSQFPAFQGVGVVPEEIMTFYDPILMTVVFFSGAVKGKKSVAFLINIFMFVNKK